MTDGSGDVLALVLGGAGPSTSDPPAAPAVSLADSARAIGAYCWAERRTFEVLGSWVANEPVEAARLLFDVYSRQHAWHADLWAERLPVTEAFDHRELVAAPSEDLGRFFDAIGSGVVPERATGRSWSESRVGVTDPGRVGAFGPAHAPGGGTLLRLAGFARVLLPRFVASYVHHLRRLSAVADAPVARALKLVLADEVEEWQAAELLVQSFLRRPHDVEVLSGHQRALEALVVTDGPGIAPLG